MASADEVRKLETELRQLVLAENRDVGRATQF